MASTEKEPRYAGNALLDAIPALARQPQSSRLPKPGRLGRERMWLVL
jgi:hypothetical protein